ncbi:hypothetical protein EVAR_31992_1 [Eumeta japonica]|uniref:Uncharacterized protein n=1 Tax=Eumeta variegata TaxID=151549 RepID=A0A4C1VUX7_EUMVA|nr:hypothetical protein EVAR_31992_1 [Eumeta japonica]
MHPVRRLSSNLCTVGNELEAMVTGTNMLLMKEVGEQNRRRDGTKIEKKTAMKMWNGIKIKSLPRIEIKNLRLTARSIGIKYEEIHSMSTLAKSRAES